MQGWSYDRWAAALSAAAGRHNARLNFGPSTHDAWRAGVSPDDYAAAHRDWPTIRYPIPRSPRA